MTLFSSLFRSGSRLYFTLAQSLKNGLFSVFELKNGLFSVFELGKSLSEVYITVRYCVQPSVKYCIQLSVSPSLGETGGSTFSNWNLVSLKSIFKTLFMPQYREFNRVPGPEQLLLSIQYFIY